MLRKLLPHNTGTARPDSVASRIARLSDPSSSVPDPRYSSSNSSSPSATFSSSASLASCAASAIPSGTGPSEIFAPRLSPSNRSALIVTKSTTPSNPSSAPIGNCTGIAGAPSRSAICATTRSKSAPMRSILLTNAIRGTP